MKSFTVFALVILAVIFVLLVAAIAYFVFTPVGGCHCQKISGNLKEISVSDDNRTVKFKINLEYPKKVYNWTDLVIKLNISGNYFGHQYPGPQKTWRNGNYTAKIIDVDNDGAIDSGDHLIIHSDGAPFKTGDGIMIYVSGICSNIYTTIDAGVKQ